MTRTKTAKAKSSENGVKLEKSSIFSGFPSSHANTCGPWLEAIMVSAVKCAATAL